MKRWIVAAGAALATIAAAAVVAPAAQAGIDTPRVLLVQECIRNGSAAGPSASAEQIEITVTGNPGDSFGFVNIQCGSGHRAAVRRCGHRRQARSPTVGERHVTRSAAQPERAPLLVQTPFGNARLHHRGHRRSPVTTPVLETHDTLQQVGVPAFGLVRRRAPVGRPLPRIPRRWLDEVVGVCGSTTAPASGGSRSVCSRRDEIWRYDMTDPHRGRHRPRKVAVGTRRAEGGRRG